MGLFDDPLMRRELAAVSRRKFTFVARTLAGVAMAFAVSYFWTQGSRISWQGSSFLAALSKQIFVLQFVFQMIFLPLLGVAGASDLVTKELRQGTLGLLFLTPLSPWRMLAGKWKAVMVQILSLFVAGAPIAAICSYLEGAGPFDLLWGTTLPLSFAALAAALTLLVSMFCRTPALVMISTILLLLGLTFLPVLLFGDEETFLLFAAIHPVFAAVVCMAPQWLGTGGVAESAWASAPLSFLALSWILLWIASRRLPGRLLVVPGPGLLSRIMRRLDAFYESINVGRRRLRFGSGEVWESRGLLWKELHTRTAGRLRYAVRIAVVLLLVGVLPFTELFSASGNGKVHFLWAVSGLLLLQAVVAGLSLFVQEKEGRQWDILLSTPLRPWDVVASKLLGGLPSLVPTAAVGALYLGALAWFSQGSFVVWMLVAIPVGLFTLFAYLLSAAASLRCRTHRGAFLLSTGILSGILLVLPAALNVLDSLPGVWLSAKDYLAWSHPAWYLGLVGERLRWGWNSWWSGAQDLTYLPHFAAVYAGAGIGMVAWMARRFDRLTGRA